MSLVARRRMTNKNNMCSKISSNKFEILRLDGFIVEAVFIVSVHHTKCDFTELKLVNSDFPISADWF